MCVFLVGGEARSKITCSLEVEAQDVDNAHFFTPTAPPYELSLSDLTNLQALLRSIIKERLSYKFGLGVKITNPTRLPPRFKR